MTSLCPSFSDWFLGTLLVAGGEQTGVQGVHQASDGLAYPSLGTVARWEAKQVQHGDRQCGRGMTAAETGATPMLNVRA